MSETRRIAVFGGTFDPFHRGHLDPLLSAFSTMGWSEILYVPAASQPFKQGRHATSPFHRYAMLTLGLEDEPLARITIMELERGGVSYSVDTVERIAAAEPEAVIDWIIGDDNLDLLPKWKSIDRIFELANFAVLRRIGATLPAALEKRKAAIGGRPSAGAVLFLDNSKVEVSSTMIRRRLAEGQSIAGLVKPAVERYIIRHGLYTGREQQEELLHA